MQSKHLFCHTYMHIAKPDSSELYHCTSGTKPWRVSAGQHLQTHKAYKQILWAWGTCVPKGHNGRGTATSLTAALRGCVIIAVKMQPLEAVRGSLLENFHWQCTFTHNEAGLFTHLPNPVFFAFEREENKNTLWNPYPWRYFCSSLCLSRRTLKSKSFPITFDLSHHDFVI